VFAPPIQLRLVSLARRCVSAWDAATKLAQGHVALQKLSAILDYGFFMFWGALADVADGLVKGKGAMVKECHEVSKQKAFDGIAELLARADDLHGLKEDCEKILAAEAAVDLYDKVRAYEQAHSSLAEFHRSLEKLKGTSSEIASQIDPIIKKLAESFDDPVEMKEVGRVLGNLTGFHALHRDLKVGESRSTLATRCLKGVEKKRLLSMDPKLDLTLKALVPTATSVRGAQAPIANTDGQSVASA